MIFDVEADGLLDEATKIHCLAYYKDKKVQVTSDYDEMRKILLSADQLIGHNIILYDIPLLERILSIKIKAELIDTLALSWYLNHKRIRHGLEEYGDEYGIPKPEIKDWVGLSEADYQHRCMEDVKINLRTWLDLKKKLLTLYSNKIEADRLIKYLSFKLDCIREQHRSGWKLDRELAEKNVAILLAAQEEKIDELKKVMPSTPIKAIKTPPAKPYKKGGGLSAHGVVWQNFLKERGLPSDYREPVEWVSGLKEPNPNSTDQVKSWLFSLGWVPETFKYEKNPDGSERAIPQLRVEGDNGKELCPSIIAMCENNPELQALEGLSVIQHRLGILEGFLKNVKDGWLIADIGGLTNTLRFKHRILVNLPGIHRPYGKEIRGSLIAEDGYILCGSDMSSLEDNTKKHYMFPYDPDFVEAMSDPSFDPHLNLAEFAKAIKPEDTLFYVSFKKKLKDPFFIATEEEKKRWKQLDVIRKIYKAANYACIYGVGAAKLARATGLTIKQAKNLIKVYWKRNWSVKQFSEDAAIQEIDGEMWVYNPVSRFWYSLRAKKDVFSTINQSTGVYCFDLWIREIRAKHNQLTAQFHDEIVKHIKEGAQEKCREVLLNAIDQVNNKLKLNVTLRVDIQFGKTYADIH